LSIPPETSGSRPLYFVRISAFCTVKLRRAPTASEEIVKPVTCTDVVKLQEGCILHEIVTGELTLDKIGFGERPGKVLPVTDLLHLVI
jgi:hypothetical protein